MPSIETLVRDILGVFGSDTLKVDPQQTKEFSDELSRVVAARTAEASKTPVLRLSNLGSKCRRQLWYKINRPEKAESLSATVRLKFLYGDILESMLLWLARVSGHEVRGCQDELSLHGVLGHRDAVIDGVLVDVKSASSFAFNKFLAGLTPENDDFGYRTQLDAYLHASTDLERPNVGAFLVVDKVLGRLTLDVHEKSSLDYKVIIEDKQAMLSRKEPPPRAFVSEPDGKSGNQKLPVQCSYCQFKRTCWPGVRTFLYSGGPRYLTVVKETPRVPEVFGDGADDPE